MKNRKRFMALALAAAMSFSLTGSYVFAEEAGTEDVSEESTSGTEEEVQQADDLTSDGETTLGTDAGTDEDDTEADTDATDAEAADSESEIDSESETASGTAADSDETVTSSETADTAVDYWYLNVDYQNNPGCVLVGETASIVVYLQHTFSWDGNSYEYETIPVADMDYSVYYAEEIVDIAAEPSEDGYGLVLNVTGLSAGGSDIAVWISVDGEYVVQDSMYMGVTDEGYYYLDAEQDEIELPLGGDYVLTDAGI